MMEKLCCISLTLAARFIGAFDLSTAILAINFITKEFFSDEERLLAFDKIQIFLGMSWANRSANSQPKLDYQWILVCLIVYSIVHLVCSADLILATIFRKKNYAMPWLIFEVISLATQASVLAKHIFMHQCIDGMAMVGPAYVAIASLYLFFGTYCWFVVYAAQKSWPTKELDVFSEVDKSTLAQSHGVNQNSQKTPSRVIAGNHSIFESPKSPISSKYYEL